MSVILFGLAAVIFALSAVSAYLFCEWLANALCVEEEPTIHKPGCPQFGTQASPIRRSCDCGAGSEVTVNGDSC